MPRTATRQADRPHIDLSITDTKTENDISDMVLCCKTPRYSGL